MEYKKEKIIFNIVVSVLIIILCFMITPFTFQNDTYYTIKIGETISNQGIDMIDNYSFHDNLSYTYPHWLFDYITYKVYQMGGYLGVYLMTCVFCSILGLSLYFLNYKMSNNNLISMLITVFSMFLIYAYITARAQIVTFTLFIFEVYFIERFLKNKKISNVIALFIISVLIANVHIAVWPFFFILFLPHLVAQLIAFLGDISVHKNLELDSYKKELVELEKENTQTEKIKNYKEKIAELEEKQKNNIKNREEKLKNPYKIIITRNKNVKWLCLIMIICFFSAFISPLGGKTTLTYLLKTMTGNTTHYISEHQPSVLINNVPLLVVFILSILLLTFKNSKIQLKDLFLLAGLLVLSFISVRQTSMLIILCSYIFTNLIGNSVNANSKKINEITYTLIKHPISLLYISIFVTGIGASVLGHNLPPKFVDETEYPVEATKYIKENLDVKNVRLFNEYKVGSYLLFNDIPVFIDSRADLYTPEFNKECTVFDDYTDAESGKVYFEDIFEKYNITHIILNKSNALYTYVNGANNVRYNLLYSDDNFAVFERLSRSNAVPS